MFSSQRVVIETDWKFFERNQQISQRIIKSKLFLDIKKNIFKSKIISFAKNELIRNKKEFYLKNISKGYWEFEEKRRWIIF